ncbi:MAG: diguanylate cyclase [Methylocapsa sp.]|nr:diguanylate cyclase [Methylocapsa sp.]
MFSDPAVLILLYFIVPLWFFAGIGDWVCHRRTHIERTSGLPESVAHSIMLFQIGVMMLPAIVFEINAAVIAVAVVTFIVHEITALIDVSYTSPKRNVNFVEQSMHSLLEMVPLTAILLAATLHWDQFCAVFGFGAGDWSFTWKAHPLPTGYLASVMIATVLFAFVPYLEELFRCWRFRNLVSIREEFVSIAHNPRDGWKDEKGRTDCEAIVTALDQRLQKGDNTLIGNPASALFAQRR